MKHLFEDVVRLEVGPAAGDVDEPPGRESAFLVEDEPDSPAALLDRLMALTAFRLAARGALGPVDARQAALREAAARRAFQGLPAGNVLLRFSKPLHQRLRA